MRSPLPSPYQRRILPWQLFPLFLNSTKPLLKVITKLTLARVDSLGLRVQPPTRWPLEMSPGVISSDEEQPQTLSACSHGPEQGSSQLEGFSRLMPCVRSQQGVVRAGWEHEGSCCGNGVSPDPWAAVLHQVTKHRELRTSAPCT